MDQCCSTRSRSCCHLLRWLGLGHDPHFAFGRLSMAMRSISSRGPGPSAFRLCRGSRLPLAGHMFTGSTMPRNSCIFFWATRSQLPFAAGGKLAYPEMTRLRASNSETQVIALLLLSSTFQAGLGSTAYITGTFMGSFMHCALLLPFFFYSSSDSIVGTQV